MDFLTNIEEFRKRARRHIEEGSVTERYALDRKQAIRVLNDALATECMCVLRYRFHYFMATGINSAAVAEEFMEHAQEEQVHADQLAERIKQLGGKPELHPAVIAERSHSEYREGTSLADMIREDLIAERIAIETYREMVRYFGDKDTTSRVMMEGILAKEEEHADELADLLFAVQPDTNQGSRRLYFSDEVPRHAEGEKVKS
jgi:bacterioferritin